MNTAERTVQLIRSIPWADEELVRIFWVRVVEGSRAAYAAEIQALADHEGPVPIVVREALFLNANSVLSDINRLFGDNRAAFDSTLGEGKASRVSVAILAKDEFKLPQISSPIVLPLWFPGLGGREVHIRVADLEVQAEVDLLNSPEACSEQIAAFLLDLEVALVEALDRAAASGVDPRELMSLLNSTGKDALSTVSHAVDVFREHLAAVTDRRAYRPSLKSGASFVSRLIRLVLKSSPDQLASVAKILASGLGMESEQALRPPLFAVLLRPTVKMDASTKNMHSLLISVYQAYQFLTASAHAGDYPMYPVGLVRTTSLDVRSALAALTVATRRASQQ